MATTTKTKLIEIAHELFYFEGFHCVGLDRILDEVGVTKTTFYNHFESKEQLMLEVLRHHDRWWRDTFAQKLRAYGGDTPRGQLMAIFDVVTELINGPEFNGCIFVNAAVEFPARHDPVHKAAAEHKVLMEGILRELAGYAGAEHPERFAREMSLLLEGTYVTQQVTGSGDTAQIARRIAEMIVERHVPVGV